jgi:hypothetical protein
MVPGASKDPMRIHKKAGIALCDSLVTLFVPQLMANWWYYS